MPLISAKCTNCGADLEVDNIKDEAICQYCGSAFVVERAVNYYNTTNNIISDVVNVYSGDSADFVIRAGELVKYNGSSAEVRIPDTVTIIGAHAFESCEGLASIVIPDSVKEIGDYAFCRCYRLTNITIPGSVISIGGAAFRYCTGLKTVVIEEGVRVLNAVFHDWGAWGSFDGCCALTDILIPGSVEHIGQGAFSGCEALANVVISNGVVTIGKDAFYKCKRLTSVTIPGSVETIGKEAFSGCEALCNVEITSGVKRIEEGAFSGTALTNVIIPDGVRSIGAEAFNCKELLSVTIPDSVNEIRHYDVDRECYLHAFYYCPKLCNVNASEEWKRKHYEGFMCLSSYAPSQKTRGCYIATAVYGSYDCPQVWTLRRYRDNILAESCVGRFFIRTYYAISPILVKWFGHTQWFKKLWRGRLDKLVDDLQSKGVKSTPYEDRLW